MLGLIELTIQMFEKENYSLLGWDLLEPDIFIIFEQLIINLSVTVKLTTHVPVAEWWPMANCMKLFCYKLFYIFKVVYEIIVIINTKILCLTINNIKKTISMTIEYKLYSYVNNMLCSFKRNTINRCLLFWA